MVIRSKQKLKISKPFNIALIEPEIPQNTGNIARLCAVTNSRLHLVHPLGFDINDKYLKRAGLDYWPLLDVSEYEGYEQLKESSSNSKSYYLSTRGEKNIWDIDFTAGDYLIFGSESKGINENILEENKDNVVSIPMNGLGRSMNLATAVGIVLYEALRQAVKSNEYDIVPI